jgi:alcohol dehydrogenase class IV
MTHTGTKLLFGDIRLASRLIVIDPLANIARPATLMPGMGMNGLVHCIEGLYSKGRTPIATALALHAIPQFFEALLRSRLHRVMPARVATC